MGPPPRLTFTCVPWAGGLCLALGATGVSQSQPVSLTLAPCECHFLPLCPLTPSGLGQEAQLEGRGLGCPLAGPG